MYLFVAHQVSGYDEFARFYIIAEDEKTADKIFLDHLTPIINNEFRKFKLLSENFIKKKIKELGWVYKKCPSVIINSKIQGTKIDILDRKYTYKYKKP